MPGDDDWHCDWEAARRRKLTLALVATPAERLQWLEEAIRLAWRTGALPRPRAEWSSRDERCKEPGGGAG